MKTRTLAGCRPDVGARAAERLLDALLFEANKFTEEQIAEARRLLERRGMIVSREVSDSWWRREVSR